MSTAKPIRALARGLEVVRVLNEQRNIPLSLLSERTGMSRATLLRILKTLDRAGWVYRNRADSHYRLASDVCQLGRELLTLDQLVESAAPVMDSLFDAVGWPSDIAVYSRSGMQIVESTRRMCPEIGNLNPVGEHAPVLCSALGQAYLAFCPMPEREAIFEKLRTSSERSNQMIYNRHWVARLLADTRARGYSVTESGCCGNCWSGIRGLGAMAVPVTSHGQIRACLSLVWIKSEDSRERMAEWLSALLAAAQEITDSLHRREMRDAT